MKKLLKTLLILLIIFCYSFALTKRVRNINEEEKYGFSNDTIIFIDSLFSHIHEDSIKSNTLYKLDDIVPILLEDTTTKIKVIGFYWDFIPANGVPEKKSRSVVSYFINKGIEEHRLIVVGYYLSKCAENEMQKMLGIEIHIQNE